MTLMVFFGCAFIAFGPACAMFAITVAGDAQQVIVLITSAFFWLVSLLISSIWWMVVSPLKDQLAFGITFSVIFQELFRLAYYFLIRKADEGLLSMINNQSHLRKHRIAYGDGVVWMTDCLYTRWWIMCAAVFVIVAGLGYGLMSGLFAMVNVLADITGPGSMGLKGDPQNFLIVSAFLTSCFVLLNTFWGVILFESCDKKKWLNFALVLFSHLFVSLMTLLNVKGNYLATLISAYLVMIIMAVVAFKSAGGTFFNVYRVLSRKSHPDYAN